MLKQYRVVTWSNLRPRIDAISRAKRFGKSTPVHANDRTPRMNCTFADAAH